MIGSGSVGVAVIVAVALSNLPEGISATSGLISAGHSDRFIFGLWVALALACATSAALGYAVLGALDPSAVAVTQAFAAGAILTMLVDTMVPEAVEHAGQWVGLVTVAGFLLSMLISFSG